MFVSPLVMINVLCMWLKAQGQVHVAVRKLLAAYGDEVGSITTTGHSLGGALATLCAFDLVGFPLKPSSPD